MECKTLNIPKTVKIGGKVYDVEITDKFDLGNVNVSAEIIYTDLVIRVSPNQAPGKMEADFIHELIYGMPKIDLSNVFVVWSCKTLQNYKALLSTTISGDGVYVEYTYNGDKQELYEDFYIKSSNRKIVDE